MSEIGEMTDRQIVEIYFHKRDEEGKIVFPDDDKEDTLESELMGLTIAKTLLGDRFEGYEEAREALIKKYQE